MKNLLKAAFSGLIAVGSAAAAFGSPVIDGAVVNTRVFNDAPNSTVTVTNLYPSQVSITDADLYTPGTEFTNRHNFRLSDNGGISEAVFSNGDPFSISANIRISGSANSEGGLQISPWWSKEVDGQFMINATSGEIAAFGGRLPFYSFTANQGLTYVKGTTVTQALNYNPHSLSQADPATVEYLYTDASGTYTSGPLAFDEGNPGEDPPYGLWGILNDARVGGYFQPNISHTDPSNSGTIDFTNIVYTPEPASLALLALGGLSLLRRRG